MKETEDDLEFHYHRENRIEHAPKNVKKWYDGTAQSAPKGFFEAFIHTKASRIILITLIIVLASYGVSFFVSQQKQSAVLSGIPVKLSAFTFEETLYISIKASEVSEKKFKKISNNTAEIPIEIHIKYLGEDGYQIGVKNLTGFYTGKEAFYRTTTPNYDILSVETELVDSNTSINLITKVQQK